MTIPLPPRNRPSPCAALRIPCLPEHIAWDRHGDPFRLTRCITCHYGAAHGVVRDATAFTYRDANFATVIAGMWPEPEGSDPNIAWERIYFDAIAPLFGGGRLRQLLADDEQGRITANYKGN
jgi:hypothetical protein